MNCAVSVVGYEMNFRIGGRCIGDPTNGRRQVRANGWTRAAAGKMKRETGEQAAPATIRMKKMP